MKPPVLLVGNFLSSSTGIRSICEDLAPHLMDSGWPVITTSAKPGQLTRVGDMVSTVWRKRDRYALAHVEIYSGLAFIWAELVCESLKHLGKPYILTLHGGRLPDFAKQWPRRVQRLLRSAAAVTTPSEYMHERMKRYRADLFLLPNPIDIDNYRFIPRKNPRPKLIWLRAFHKIYNPSLAVRVIALLAEDFPDIQLTMVGSDKGDGSLRQMKRLAADLGIARHMTFPGSIPKNEVPMWLNGNDIFINTTDVDNMPVSVLEAMACGLCVVSTNVGGIPNLIEDNRDGLLVAANDAEEMAMAIRRILDNEQIAERISHHARQRATRFDWSVILPEWEKLLASATLYA